MPSLTQARYRGAAIGLDHVGIVGADLEGLARTLADLGFHLTRQAVHASGRTHNRCVMLRDGSYLELMATVPGQNSATLDRFLSHGPGAHVLALETDDEMAALERLQRAGLVADIHHTERDADPAGSKARFTLIVPPDTPTGRVLLIRQLTRDLLWRPDNVVHANHAAALTEVVYATDAPAETIAQLSRLAGHPAKPDPLGGYGIPLVRGVLRVLPRHAAAALFPGVAVKLPMHGLTIAVDDGTLGGTTVDAGSVAIRFVSGAT